MTLWTPDRQRALTARPPFRRQTFMALTTATLSATLNPDIWSALHLLRKDTAMDPVQAEHQQDSRE